MAVQVNIREEAKRILGINRGVAGAYTESERAKIDGIELLVNRAVDEAIQNALDLNCCGETECIEALEALKSKNLHDYLKAKDGASWWYEE